MQPFYKNKLIKPLFLSFTFLFLFASSAFAQANFEKPILEKAEVVKILGVEALEGSVALKLEAKISSGEDSGQVIMAEDAAADQASLRQFKPGDKITVSKVIHVDGTQQFLVIDYDRSGFLLFSALALALLVVLIGGWKGFRSIVSLFLSFLVIFYFIIPQIVKGSSPVLITIIGSVIMLMVLLYLTHGFNRKTAAAVIGTLISLVLTGLLAMFLVGLSKLTGLSEDAFYVQSQIGNINIYGLLLSGIILGAVGVLDDLCIGQASAVWELHQLDKKLDKVELYKKAMNIGVDHISASVNTLAMAYVGASLPLVLLFTQSGVSPDIGISTEVIAQEVVRTIIGSFGLLLAVPITTIVAVNLVKRS